MKFLYRLIEDLSPAEQAQACADTGHSLAALHDVFLWHGGIRWKCRAEVWPSHVRYGHVVEAKAVQPVGKRLDVEVCE